MLLPALPHFGGGGDRSLEKNLNCFFVPVIMENDVFPVPVGVSGECSLLHPAGGSI